MAHFIKIKAKPIRAEYQKDYEEYTVNLDQMVCFHHPTRTMTFVDNNESLELDILSTKSLTTIPLLYAI